jgi:hypothetical protein
MDYTLRTETGCRNGVLGLVRTGNISVQSGALHILPPHSSMYHLAVETHWHLKGTSSVLALDILHHIFPLCNKCLMVFVVLFDTV